MAFVSVKKNNVFITKLKKCRCESHPPQRSLFLRQSVASCSERSIGSHTNERPRNNGSLETSYHCPTEVVETLHEREAISASIVSHKTLDPQTNSLRTLSKTEKISSTLTKNPKQEDDHHCLVEISMSNSSRSLTRTSRRLKRVGTVLDLKVLRSRRNNEEPKDQFDFDLMRRILSPQVLNHLDATKNDPPSQLPKLFPLRRLAWTAELLSDTMKEGNRFDLKYKSLFSKTTHKKIRS